MTATEAQAHYFAEWRKAKDANQGRVVLVKAGDWLETFSNDALIANRELGIPLRRLPTELGNFNAGIPPHAVSAALAALREAGFYFLILGQIATA